MDAVEMFKKLVLGALYNLSDDQIYQGLQNTELCGILGDAA